MAFTTWAQEQRAKHEAWNEIIRLKAENKKLEAERDAALTRIEQLREAVDAVRLASRPLGFGLHSLQSAKDERLAWAHLNELLAKEVSDELQKR